MAAAAAAATLHSTSSPGNGWTVMKRPATLGFFRENAVEVERKSEIDSNKQSGRMKKLDSNAQWKERRLVATKDQLYLMASKGHSDAFEIVDAIPMNEITEVSVINLAALGVLNEDESSIVNKLRQMPSKARNNSYAISDSASSFRAAKPNNIEGSMKVSKPGFAVGAKKNVEKVIQGTEKLSAFEIHTLKDGFNMGRTYYFSAGSPDSREEWMRGLQHFATAAVAVHKRNNAVKSLQAEAQKVYNSFPFQCLIILAITSNFVLTLLQSEIGDAAQACSLNSHNLTANTTLVIQNTNIQYAFDRLDFAFTIIFASELLFNFCAHAVVPFFENKWNWFDSVVVLVSIAILFLPSTSNDLVKQVRILRVFRVLRIFGRIGQLREIVGAISSSIIPAMQALLIGLIVVAIYATIGTQYFSEENPQGFCDFFHSFYTMFGVVAFSQPNGINAFDDDGRVRLGAVIFIYSYVAIVSFVLLQVLVAVLLDSFYRARQNEKEEVAKNAAMKERLAQAHNLPMDPLLEVLAASFDTHDNLTQRLDQIFDALDTDSTESLSFSEMSEGIFKFNGVRLRFEDFEAMTEWGAMCNSEHELERDSFHRMMLRQLRAFMQRRMADALYNKQLGADMTALLTTMKLVMIELEQIKGDVYGIKSAVRKDLEEIKQNIQALAWMLLPSTSDSLAASHSCPQITGPMMVDQHEVLESTIQDHQLAHHYINEEPTRSLVTAPVHPNGRGSSAHSASADISWDCRGTAQDRSYRAGNSTIDEGNDDDEETAVC